MPAPTLGSWSTREVVTAAKLNAQVRNPYRYLSAMPQLSCRGVVAGQSVPRGQRAYIKWAAPNLDGFRPDSASQWFTVPDTGIYIVTATLTLKAGAIQLGGDGIAIFIAKRATSGTITSIAAVREIMQQQDGIQVVSAVAAVHFQAGEAIATASYLDSRSPSSTYNLQSGEWEGLFSAVMVGPGTTSFSAPTAPPPAMETWTDGTRIGPADMTRRITAPLQALYSPARFACRAVSPYSSPSNVGRQVSWATAEFEQCGGWALSRDGTAVTVPASGVYLICLSLAIQRDGTAGPYGSWQVNLLRNGQLVSLHQRQNTGSSYGSSTMATEVVYLNAGDTVSTYFIGTGTGLTWRNFWNGPNTESWDTFAAVMLAPTATSMEA
ncbi:hypothetical protein ACFU99_00770 [Streptomyces sp. NPDC057654]|uniref:hypothetical protein n=1 Tax=Streptomyces sp. NPDC057654 TaxID=3346196 RepID=UPI00369D75AB